MRRFNAKSMVLIAMFAAIGALLMLVDLSIPIFPSFLKLDFSDMPALIASFMLGPVAGVMVELFKNLLDLLITGSSTGYIGEVANFLVGSALVVPAGLFYMRKNTRKGALMGMLFGIISMATVAALANYFMLIPFYSTIMPIEKLIKSANAIFPYIDSIWKLILFSIVPFNILKGFCVSLITFLIYKRLSRFIRTS